MSSFDEVKRAVAEVLKDDGTLGGTAFFVLPGYAITCHHVVYPLRQLRVRFPGDGREYPATYVPDWSDPVADVAVLAVGDVQDRAVQLGAAREGTVAFAYGYRPSRLSAEPEGHAFRGAVGPGQQLRLAPSLAVASRLSSLPDSERAPWNVLPEESRQGEVLNFEVAAGLEQGISGGPVYDPHLRRVVGLFRAVEGERLAYVIPLAAVLRGWPELQLENQRQVPDVEIDRLARLGVSPVAEGANPVHAVSAGAFTDLLDDAAARFGGRETELAALDEEMVGGGTYVFVTGLAGFGKTSLLAAWTARLRDRPEVATAAHVIALTIDPSEDFCLRNLSEQLCELHGLGGALPQTGFPLRALYAELLGLGPPPDVRLAVVLDGLDEAVGWEPRHTMFPTGLPPRTTVVFSARTIVGKHWLGELKLTGEQVRVLTLDRMTLAEVRDAAGKNGLDALIGPSFVEAVDRIHRKSQGDPFYLRYILEDVLERPDEWQAVLDSTPMRVDDYLASWWRQVSEVADDHSVRDLVGYLLVANGPLPRKALVDISNDDALTGASFERTIGRVRRHLIGDDISGYLLCHPRFRDYIITSERFTEDERVQYHANVVAWCNRFAAKGWPPDTPEYVLRQYPTHLMELGDRGRTRLYEIARDVALPGRSRERFPDAPELALAPSETGLLAAARDDDVGLMVEFLLTRARLRAKVTGERSPLDELATGDLPSALRLADLHEMEVRVLLYLCIAWELADDGPTGSAVGVLRRLAGFPNLPRLTDERAEVLVYLLAQVCELDVELYATLRRRLVFDDGDRERLCFNILARVDPGRVAEAQADNRWFFTWWSTWGLTADQSAPSATGARRPLLQAAYAAAESIGKAWMCEAAAAAVITFALAGGDVELAEALAGPPTESGRLVDVQIGVGFLELGQEERGRSLLVAARSRPLPLGGLLSAGAILLKAGQTEFAEACFDAARESIMTTVPEDQREPYLIELVAARARGGHRVSALNLARELPDPALSAAVVATIAAESINEGDLDFALQTVESVPDPQHQARVLAAIAEALAATGDLVAARPLLGRAHALVRAIEDPEARNRALVAIASAMAKSGDIEGAQAVAAQLDSLDETEILQRAIEATARLGDFSKATGMALKMDRFDQQKSLATIALVQAQKGDFSAALAMADVLGRDTFGIVATRTVYAIASLQALTGKAREARRTVFRALTQPARSQGLDTRLATLSELVDSRVFANELAEAHAVAELIDAPEARFQALLRIAGAEMVGGTTDAASETLATARALVPEMASLRSQLSALLRVASVAEDLFPPEERLDALVRAEALTDVVEDAGDQERWLSEIGSVYLHRGDVPKALALADRIENAERRADALIRLVRWQGDLDPAVIRIVADRALEVVGTLGRERARRLAELVGVWAGVGDFDRALATASLLQDTYYEVDALSAVAVAQATSGSRQGAEATFDLLVARLEKEDDASISAWRLVQAQVAAGRADLARQTAVRFAVDPGQLDLWTAKSQLEKGEPRQAFRSLEGSLDSIDEDDANLARDVGRALLATGGPEDVASAEILLAAMNPSQYRDWLLGDLMQMEVGRGRYDAAMTRAAEMSGDERRAEAYAAIAAGQAKDGRGTDAVETVLEILTDPATHLVTVARSLAEAGDVENLKRLLGRCADSQEAAYGACVALATAFPDQTLTIARQVARFGD